MTRIAYVIGGLPFGGVENWLFDIARLMQGSQSHACRIFNVSGTGVKLPEYLAAGLDVVCIGSSNAAASSHRIDTVLRLRRALKQYSPDIIHTLHFSGDYFGRLAAIDLHVPVITHIRNVKREKKTVRRFFNRFLSRYTSAYISISRAVEEVVEMDHNMCTRPQFVLHNAIDTKRLDVEPHDLRAMYGLQGHIILGVGRYVEQKNFENLVRALRLLLDAGKDASLVLVGEGSKRAHYESLIRDLGLGGRVALTGYRNDVGAFFRGADILAMPSLFEGFGNVHLEAMYCNLPAVVSRFVASLEVGLDAALVCECSPESIAAQITVLIDDAYKRQALIEAGRRIVAEFTIERYVERLFAIYAKVLAVTAS
jgi:glycosyltransferase involved in cell wall biosynthesis